MKPLGARKDAWRAYLAAERLRVKDLEPQPGHKEVRRLAGALVAAQMDQLAVSLVLGVSQMSVSRYVQASERSAQPSSSCVPLPPRSGKTESRRETAERVVNDLVRKSSEAPLVPTDALTLVVTSSAHVKEYVGEFVSGLSDGAQLTEQGEALLLQAVRELEALAGTLRRTGGPRCVSV
jgi:predicted transcriptional regulator